MVYSPAHGNITKWYSWAIGCRVFLEFRSIEVGQRKVQEPLISMVWTGSVLIHQQWYEVGWKCYDDCLFKQVTCSNLIEFFDVLNDYSYFVQGRPCSLGISLCNIESVCRNPVYAEWSLTCIMSDMPIWWCTIKVGNFMLSALRDLNLDGRTA